MRPRLTDAFNEMLAGIQTRDEELSQHRGNLERLVTERTTELSRRNEAMRLVLDNVEQGLATIEPSGRLSSEQREIISTFEHLMRDRSGTLEFFQECDSLVKQTLQGPKRDRQSVLRALHTLKGNAGTFGVTSVANAAHELETQLIGSPELPSESELEALLETWRVFAERLGRLLGNDAESVVEVGLSELETLIEAAESGASGAQLSAMLARLQLERAPVRLRRIGDQARSLAQRLGKGALRIEVQSHGDVRFERQHWAAFWAAFVHPLRNALDHGIEAPAERASAGKSPGGKLLIAVRGDARSITIELSDDGRGIDFDKVRVKARQLGLPHTSEADLIEALFSDGFSTPDEVTELSGRGVGMSALREAAHALGGVVSLQTRRGQGTTLRVRVPV